MKKLALAISMAFAAGAMPTAYAVPSQATASGEKRIALLIGNSSYKQSPLENPVNDARDLAKTLNALGFDVTEKENLDPAGMKSAIRDFGKKLQRDSIALFFYAGHGVQVKGTNYLVPVGRNFKSEQDIETDGVSTDFVTQQLEGTNSRVGIIILDACRNNPFAAVKSRSLAGRGLARIEAPSGSLVAFSTAPGNEASDGDGKNGLYTKHLLINVKTPGLTVEQVFKRTREGVERESEGEQSPREESSLKGDDFYFMTSGQASVTNVSTSKEAIELAFWDTIKNSDNAADFSAYLKEFPSGKFSSLAKNQASRLEVARKDNKSRNQAQHAEAITLRTGDQLPTFAVDTLDGSKLNDKTLSARPMSISYFFAKDKCKTCLPGLEKLKALAARFPTDELVIAAFGKDVPAQLKTLTQGAPANFYVAQANDTLLQHFHISEILPTVIVTGPGGEIVNVIQGGGSSTDAMLLALADLQLARKNPEAAENLFAEVGGRGLNAAIARTGQAYSLLNKGKRTEAEGIFRELANNQNAEASLRGKEGLAEIYLKTNQIDLATKEVTEALALGPNRAPANLLKARILAASGKRAEAESAIALAASESAVSDFAWQKSAALVARGNLLRKKAPQQALAAYRDAKSGDAYSGEALANQGVVLQELGDPKKAIEILQKGGKLSPGDQVVQALLRQAQASMAQQQDLARQKYIDDSVKELVTRFNEQKNRKQTTPADDWTSPPMVVSVLEFQNNSGPELLGRVGMDKLFVQELSNQLQAKNITVVDRALLDKLLAELKLGSSELADPDTQLKLGRILAARVIVTGSLSDLGAGKLISLRAIDTETTNIPLSVSRKEPQTFEPVDMATQLAQATADMVKKKYPLKGRIALANDDRTIINLGKKHGVAPGQVFNVLGKGVPIELNGKILGYQETKLGQLEITEVEDLMAYAKPVDKKGDFEKNQRIILKDTN